MKRLLLTSLAAIAIAASGAFAQQSTLDVVKKSGELVVGLGMECAPFSYRDAGGNLVGFEVDLTNVLVKNLEFSLEGLSPKDAGHLQRLAEKVSANYRRKFYELLQQAALYNTNYTEDTVTYEYRMRKV